MIRTMYVSSLYKIFNSSRHCYEKLNMEIILYMTETTNTGLRMTIGQICVSI